MATEACGEAHPEQPELRCHLSAGTHREHEARDGSGGYVEWPNQAWVPMVESKGTIKRRVTEKAAEVRESVTVKLHRDPHDTEVTAATKAAPKAGRDRWEIFCVLLNAYPGGATDEELQASLSLPPNSERPRRVELVSMGWAEESAERRPTAQGNPSIVWRMTERALTEALAATEP